MVGVRTDALGVSVGQPGRIDQQSEAYQDRLRAGVRLDIPQSGLDRTRDQPKDAATRRGGFAAQDRAAAESGAAWQSRRTSRWDRFSEGRGRQTPSRSQGAVVIDGQGTGVHAAKELAPEAAPPGATPPRDAWSGMRRLHQQAARFEEYAQESVQPFFGTGAGKVAPRRRGVLVDD